MIPKLLNEVRVMRASHAPSCAAHDIFHMTADTYFARRFSKNCTHWIENTTQGVPTMNRYAQLSTAISFALVRFAFAAVSIVWTALSLRWIAA